MDFNNQVPKIQTANDWMRMILSGLCMGVADIIPGISGGTIAFILGFYEDLLNSIQSLNKNSIKTLFSGNVKEFFQMIAWKFILGLVIGIIIAMVTLSHVIGYILGHEEYRAMLYATFFGLIIAATILCSQQLKQWKFSYSLTFLLTAFVAFCLTGSSFKVADSKNLYSIRLEKSLSMQSAKNYDAVSHMLSDLSSKTLLAMRAKGIIAPSTLVYNQETKLIEKVADVVKSTQTQKFDLWIIFCGAIAICAMILPGISGSYLLTILGMYAVVVGALADLTSSLIHRSFDSTAFFILVNMLLGIILGALFFTRFVSWILNKYHDLAIVALTGFMVGALRSVWPFWTYQHILLPLKLEKGLQLEPLEPFLPSLSDPFTWVTVGLALMGAMSVFILNFLANKKASKEKLPA